MTIKVGINGFGRIGRMVCRIMTEQSDEFEIVHINDLFPASSLAHLLKYDSVHGTFSADVGSTDDAIIVNGKSIAVSGERNPSDIPWGAKGVDVVVESTGVFRTMEKIKLHIAAGAKKVLLTVPAKDEIDATIVLGVNDEMLKPEHKVISNASCTTNSLAPMMKVLNDTFGVVEGLMTTIHGYTSDQRIMDLAHSDMRRARAAALNIIPTTTGAAKAVGKVIPALNGKLSGMAMRVPVPDGSVTDAVVMLEKEATVEAVNAAMKAAADGPMKGIMQYSEEALVSTDIIGRTYSCVFDAGCTMMIGSKMVKVIGWYDNEWGYSNRVCDLIAKAAKM